MRYHKILIDRHCLYSWQRVCDERRENFDRLLSRNYRESKPAMSVAAIATSLACFACIEGCTLMKIESGLISAPIEAMLVYRSFIDRQKKLTEEHNLCCEEIAKISISLHQE